MKGNTICVLSLLAVLGLPTSSTLLGKRSTDNTQFWVTFSTHVRPGMTMPVTVKLLVSGVTSSVSVTLQNDTDQQIIARAPARNIVGGGAAQIFEIQIPQLKSTQSKSGFSIHVEGTGNARFSGSAKVTLLPKSFSIFVQTDKAVYKPGQTVKLRALAMFPDLTVLTEPMNVLIEDPHGNGIRQWTRVRGVSNTGVVELSMPTSQHPPLGIWTISVTVLGYTQNKTFTIDEYVLPTFDTKLDLPSYILTGDSKLTGTVSSKYTYGKPLTEADVLVTATLDAPARMLNKTGTLNTKGEMKFSITNQELMDLVLHVNTLPNHSLLENKTLTVIANVTDTRTGRTTGVVSTVQLYKNPAIVTFLPISANTFKPGLTYTAYVSVTKPDGTRFTNLNSTVVEFEVTITSESNASPTKENRILPANGLISYQVTVPLRATKIIFKVTVLNMTAFKTVSSADSPSNNFLQVHMQTENPRVGERVMFSARSTETVQKITYQVFSKAVMLATAEVISDVSAGGQTFSFSFIMEAKMAPYCRLLVFYFRSDGEVVADSISFKVDSTSPESLTFSKEQVKPGEEVDLTIRAQPNSAVFMLSVDKSVLLLKTGNDITQDMVSEELTGYNYVPEYREIWRFLTSYSLPYSTRGSNTNSIFKDVNVALIVGRVHLQISDDIPFRVVSSFRLSMLLSIKPGESKIDVDRPIPQQTTVIPAHTPSPTLSYPDRNNEISPPAEEMEAPMTQMRTFFPETWLWEFVILNNTGNTVLRRNAPDTITTWLTTAFSVHPQFGLSVLPEAAKLTTFRNVFVSLDLPYSVIRGEDLCFKAFAFNYYRENISVTLTMSRSDGIDVISMVSESRFSVDFVEKRTPMRVSHNIGIVPTQQIRETMYCISPSKLGHVTLHVTLTTTTIPGDGVEHLLLVESEGVPRTETVSVILDAIPGQTFRRFVPAIYPSEVVQGSQRITVTVTGDLLGPVFQNMNDLLRMPSGCGEQNMLYFAPNVFLIDYMQRTNTYTREIASKAENYMLTGYQRELQYQLLDGSYSAFGQSDRIGSMWLTAFVTKCFVQSMKLNDDAIRIDPNIIKKSITWMTSRQLTTGAFPEPGNVIHKDMQGGSGSGETLTAFVLIALGEADISFDRLNPSEKSSLQTSIALGRQYLESRLTSLNDSYDLAIVTYALHLLRSTAADSAFRRLEAKAVKENSTLHWERPKTNAQPTVYSWERKTDAITIETTAYALLSYMKRREIAGALSISRWMTSQRGPLGGFISTQDTVIGLQSLAEVAAAIYSPILVPIAVTIAWTATGKQYSQTVTINISTMRLLQQVEIRTDDDKLPNEVEITAVTRGTYAGLAVAEVILNYNVLQSTHFNTYSLRHEVRMTRYESFVLVIEASRVDGKTGGMTLIEVGLPTGYTVDIGHREYNVTGSKMLEIVGRNFVLYYSQLGSSPIRVILPMIATACNPVNLQPTPIRIFDYYESGGNQQQTITYELPLMKSNLVCDREPDYENCPFFRSARAARNMNFYI